MKDVTKKLLKEYEATKLEIKKLEGELDFMKTSILEDLQVGEQVETDLGTFSIASRDKWSYSVATQELEKKTKEAKKREEQDGTATATPGEPYITYREKKV